MEKKKLAFTLAEGATHVGTWKVSRQVAFTLAEVLITLGVIGVVAGITMPVLINKHKEHVTVNKVKKFYSLINQTILHSISENGYLNEWDVSSEISQSAHSDEFAPYITKYLKIIKDCGTNSGCLQYKNNPLLLNGTEAYANYDENTDFYKIILSDGSYIWFQSYSYPSPYCKVTNKYFDNLCAIFYIDINGKKAPNTVAKDIFSFYVDASGATKPLPASEDCYLDSKGWGCMSYILQNGNMNYPKEKPTE